MRTAHEFWDLLKSHELTFFAGVPCSLLESVINVGLADPAVTYIPAVREDVAGKCIGATGINALLKRITAAYVDLGYVTTRAYVPPQQSADGVLTILVAAQHGLVGETLQAPVDLSYLADTVVLLRFFEAFGRVRRAISVIKKRTGAHEATIRELRMSPEGLWVGEPLSQFRGLLTGVPEHVPSAPDEAMIESDG